MHVFIASTFLTDLHLSNLHFDTIDRPPWSELEDQKKPAAQEPNNDKKSSATGAADEAESSTDGQNQQADDQGTSQPGAYRVYPGGVSIRNTPDSSGPMGGTFCYVSESSQADECKEENEEERPITDTESPRPMEAVTQTLAESDQIATEAYLVEEGEEPPSATVVHTYFGIERKRLLFLSAVGTGVLAIVLGCVLGIVLPRKGKGDENQAPQTCGPLCGTGSGLPDPNREIFGHTCKDWDFNSTFLPKSENSTCADVYLSASYGCGCPGIEIPQESCSTLCSDGADLPDPKMVVKDIHNREHSCEDWQLKAKFDMDPHECVNYNAIGALCGCPNNEPHPDACGSICPDGSEYYHSGRHTIWNTPCEDWDTISKFLPIWYNNDHNETCEEYYSDVAHGCACAEAPRPSSACGSLCQERRICSPICQGGARELPNPDLLVRRETCQGWEMHSRLEVHSVVCPFYQMAGAHCGCDNEPPEDACGPLCGDASPPDPDLLVHGQTCESWDFMSTFLPESYGADKGAVGTGMIKSCDSYFSGIAYGCGCSDFEPPSNGCGRLCADGSPVPDPAMVVNAKTCRDLELLSLFETNPKQCSRFEIFGLLCGCPNTNKYNEDCFKVEYLENETYYLPSGGSLYSISFGNDGIFAQIQNNNDLFMIGNYHGIEDNTVSYGGGAPCGVNGPRSGSVTIVEDELVTEPTISCKFSCFRHAESSGNLLVTTCSTEYPILLSTCSSRCNRTVRLRVPR